MKLKGFLPRVMGLETEYAANGIAANGLDAKVAVRLSREMMNGSVGGRMWFANGDCFYLDAGDHPEYCTAECLNGYQVAAHDRVGELRLRAKLTNLKNKYPGDRYWLYKNNVAENGAKFGSHENFLMPREIEMQDIFDRLAPFLVSRIIWTGSGMVAPERARESYAFNLTQAAPFIYHSMSEGSTRDRAILNTRDRPLADSDLYRRVHLILGDSNILFAPTAMKFEITSLLMLMMENGELGIRRLQDPVHDLKRLNRDYDAVLHTTTGEKTAWQIQNDYFEEAVMFTERYSIKDYEVALAWWWRVIKAFSERELHRLVGQVDWVTKKHLIDRRAAKKGSLTYVQARQVDLEYHLLFGGSGLPDKLRRKYEPPSVARQIERARAHPPPTRALMRSRLMAATAERDVGTAAHWDRFLAGEGYVARTALLLDPFATEDSRVLRRLAPFL